MNIPLESTRSGRDLLVCPAPNDHNASVFLVETLEEQERQEPVAKIVCLEAEIEPILGEILGRVLLVPGVQYQGSDRRYLARGHTRVDIFGNFPYAAETPQVQGNGLVLVGGGGRPQRFVQGRGSLDLADRVETVIVVCDLGRADYTGHNGAPEAAVRASDDDSTFWRHRNS